MTGFPPASKPTSKDAVRPETKAGASKVTSKGTGGIPATLKVKNAANKPAAFPKRVADQDAGDEKTVSLS